MKALKIDARKSANTLPRRVEPHLNPLSGGEQGALAGLEYGSNINGLLANTGGATMAEEDRGTDGPSRREALKLGAAGFLALAPFGGAFAVTPESAGLPWADQAMRWMQVAFTEDNPRDCDPKVWFDFFRKTHSDVVCLSAGGSIAARQLCL